MMLYSDTERLWRGLSENHNKLLDTGHRTDKDGKDGSQGVSHRFEENMLRRRFIKEKRIV